MIPIKYTCGFWCLIMFFASCKAQKPTSKPVDVPDTIVSPSEQTDTLGSTFDIGYLMGKFDPATHPDFVTIPAQYRDAEIRYIRKDVLEAFIKMYDAAAKDGIKLQIRSATRNFDNQKRIWENKWTGRTILEDNVNAATDIKDNVTRAKKILEYSSMPGTSRHHWGTDMDFNNFTNEWFGQGEGLKLYTWMQKNASSFGFCQPYTAQGSDRHSGYFEEKWHWTYMPISSKLMKLAKSNLKNEMITGFLGSETAVEIDIVTKYVWGISPSCITVE